MSVQPNKNPKTNLKKAAFALMAIGTISLVGYFSYRTLSGLKIKESQNENTQEQFVGGAQISEQLQSECQKSVEKNFFFKRSSVDVYWI